MRVLLGYYHYSHPTDVRAAYESWLSRLRAAGIDVHGVALTLDPDGPRLGWPEIDHRWRRGDRALMELYDRLARRAEEFDVFVNYNGTSLHPELVRQLPTYNVYSCFDDPESSDLLSRPVAWSYDLCMIGNAAAVAGYADWGVTNARFWPLGFRADDYDPKLTREQILTTERDIDIALLCERRSRFRRQRLDTFAAAFPSAHYFGAGWPRGFLAEQERVPLYQRTRIGPNFHNSTGPINFRTYALPANGVLQLCDNKSHLGQIFRLGEEVVGFDDVEEAIELCRYYLAHEEERRRIAAAGWERAVEQYNEVAVFQRLLDAVGEEIGSGPARPAIGDRRPIQLLERQQRRTAARRLAHTLFSRPAHALRALLALGRSAARRLRTLQARHERS